MMTRKNDDLFEDDFLGAMRDLEARSAGDLEKGQKNPHAKAAIDAARQQAARSGDAEACKALGIFLCGDCGGSGRYRGIRVHQPKGQCFPCNGRGWFKKSYGDRMADRQKAEQKRRDEKARIREDFDLKAAGMAEWVVANAGWCDIAKSVAEMLEKGKEPSDKQIAALVSIRAKTEATRARKQAEREASRPQIDLGPIRAMFDAAVAKGAKNPTYRAEGVSLSLAKAHSVNAGMLYVKAIATDVYGGKLDGIIFKATREGNDVDFNGAGKTAAEALQIISSDPLAAAIRYGRATGHCACCGRLLVNDSVKDDDGLTSVERGIGPICARKMGLM